MTDSLSSEIMDVRPPMSFGFRDVSLIVLDEGDWGTQEVGRRLAFECHRYVLWCDDVHGNGLLILGENEVFFS